MHIWEEYYSGNAKQALSISLCPEEAGRAEFNVATPTYATVAYSATYGNSQTKLILNYFKRGSTDFRLKYFLHKILGILEFFYL